MCSDIFLKNREVFAPEIGIGNKPIDGGYYLFEKEEMEAFLKMEPYQGLFSPLVWLQRIYQSISQILFVAW
jgi:DNA (cytosine-5-)-methyltransferase